MSVVSKTKINEELLVASLALFMSIFLWTCHIFLISLVMLYELPSFQIILYKNFSPAFGTLLVSLLF